MAFETKRIYRALNGGEMKDIIPARVREAMLLDNTLNMARAFPLLKYEVQVTLTPYRSQGQDRNRVDQVAPDQSIVYECDGTYFTQADSALELTETSPVYGKDADPQALRELAGQGTVESVRTNTGELIDVRTKPGSTEPIAAPALVAIPDSPPPTPEVTKPFDPHAGAHEDAEQTEQIEAKRWASSHSPSVTEQAIKVAVDDADTARKMGGGRVSVVGDSAHGRGRR